jgi:hypothetical protein
MVCTGSRAASRHAATEGHRSARAATVPSTRARVAPRGSGRDAHLKAITGAGRLASAPVASQSQAPRGSGRDALALRATDLARPI